MSFKSAQPSRQRLGLFLSPLWSERMVSRWLRRRRHASGFELRRKLGRLRMLVWRFGIRIHEPFTPLNPEQSIIIGFIKV